MTLQNLYIGYTVTQRREFQEAREAQRKQQPGRIVEAGLKEAHGFSLRDLK